MRELKEFTWEPRTEPVGQVTFKTAQAQFGDGYTQRAANGLNNRQESWPLVFTNSKATILSISKFLDEHGGYLSFYWTSPTGLKSAFVAPGGYTVQPHGAEMLTLAVTFQSDNNPLTQPLRTASAA